MEAVDYLNAYRHKLSVADFNKMIDAGVFLPQQRMELVEGDLIDMAPMSEHHIRGVNWLNHHLNALFAEHAIISVQNAVIINEFSELYPDIAVLDYREDFYASRKPKVSDVLLLIEVANTSLSFDKTTKLSLYAESGVCEYWIFDLAAKAMYVFNQVDRQAGCYAQEKIYTGGLLAPQFDVSLQLDLQQLFNY